MSILDKIINFFKSSKKGSSREEKLLLFNVKNYERPGYANYKKCPNCKVEANTNQEIKSIFGLMNVGRHTYFQSWCRQCRKTQTLEKSSRKSSKEEGFFT